MTRTGINKTLRDEAAREKRSREVGRISLVPCETCGKTYTLKVQPKVPREAYLSDPYCSRDCAEVGYGLREPPKPKRKGRRAPKVKHGTVGGYTNAGCRCPRCKTAMAKYNERYRHGRRIRDGVNTPEPDAITPVPGAGETGEGHRGVGVAASSDPDGRRRVA
jgi:hypothetical protein